VVLVNYQNLKDYLKAVGAQPNGARGYLSATVSGCDGSFTKGAQFKTTPTLLNADGVTAFQFQGDSPATGVPTSTENIPVSDGSGPLGYLNVPPKQYTISALQTSDDPNVPPSKISERSVFVSANVFSTALMLPSTGCPKTNQDQIKISVPNVWVFPDLPNPVPVAAKHLKFQVCAKAVVTDCIEKLDVCTYPLEDGCPNTAKEVLSDENGVTIVIPKTSSSAGYLLITDGDYVAPAQN
jgi:hypothetical protein